MNRQWFTRQGVAGSLEEQKPSLCLHLQSSWLKAWIFKNTCKHGVRDRGSPAQLTSSPVKKSRRPTHAQEKIKSGVSALLCATSCLASSFSSENEAFNIPRGGLKAKACRSHILQWKRNLNSFPLFFACSVPGHHLYLSFYLTPSRTDPSPFKYSYSTSLSSFSWDLPSLYLILILHIIHISVCLSTYLKKTHKYHESRNHSLIFSASLLSGTGLLLN